MGKRKEYKEIPTRLYIDGPGLEKTPPKAFCVEIISYLNANGLCARVHRQPEPSSSLLHRLLFFLFLRNTSEVSGRQSTI
jgi:hypothetical protein